MCDHPTDTQTHYQAHPGYVVRQILDEFLLIPVNMQKPGAPQLAIMDETGKFLWERLRDGGTSSHPAPAQGCAFPAIFRKFRKIYRLSSPSHGIIREITMRGAFFMPEQVKKAPCCTGLLAHVCAA